MSAGKNAELTITYVLYPPNYKPGDGFIRCGTIKEAIRQCRKPKFGAGSTLYRVQKRRNNHGRTDFKTINTFDWY